MAALEVDFAYHQVMTFTLDEVVPWGRNFDEYTAMAVRRVGLFVCYGSVFEEYWQLSDSAIGRRTRWERVDHCPPQADGEDF